MGDSSRIIAKHRFAYDEIAVNNGVVCATREAFFESRTAPRIAEHDEIIAA